MLQTINAFFVYGTLKQSQLRGGMWPRKPIAIHEGIIQAELFDLGPYPAASATTGEHWTLGEIWQFEPNAIPATIEALDQIEDYVAGRETNLYVRQIVNAHQIDSNGQSFCTPAYTYFFANSKQLEQARIILPEQSFLSRSVACWPDSIAKVPRTISEE
jgi:gamma-glutamylcyclotransferase (GGCT)/AIG2-like uncharacterized protein YtfP